MYACARWLQREIAARAALLATLGVIRPLLLLLPPNYRCGCPGRIAHRPTHPHSLSRDSSLLGFDLDARRVSGALPSRTHTLPGRRVSISFRPRNVTDANYRPRQRDGSIQQRAISPAQPVCNASLGAECPTTRPHMVVRVSSAEIGLRAFVIGDILAISRNARASSMRCCLSPTHRPHPLPLPFPLTTTTLADRKPHDGATTICASLRQQSQPHDRNV